MSVNKPTVAPVTAYWCDGYIFRSKSAAETYAQSVVDVSNATEMLKSGHSLKAIANKFPEVFDMDAAKWQRYGLPEMPEVTVDHVFRIPKLGGTDDFAYKWRLYSICHNAHQGRWRLAVYSDIDRDAHEVDAYDLRLSPFSLRPPKENERVALSLDDIWQFG